MEQQLVEVKEVWDSVKHYAVKCANCSKWRLIPQKEKYEEIRAMMAEKLFFCETAREWRPDISCDDEADVNENEKFCWAMDKPCIPKPPRGWQRILRMRAEGGTKFADVYYVAPWKKRFRSSQEMTAYFDKHPEYRAGLNLNDFCFKAPVPLDESYVAKRQACSTSHGTPIAVALVNPRSSGEAEAPAAEVEAEPQS